MDFATLLVAVSVGVVAMAVVVPLVHRWTRGPSPTAPELRAWDDPTRPARCLRCNAGELVHLRGVQVTAELPRNDAGLHLPIGTQRNALDLELLVCSSCGRAEWFAASPRALEPYQKAALSAAPYRDASGNPTPAGKSNS